MQVEVITRIIFKIPEEADAVEAMQEQIRSNPNSGVYTRIIRTDSTVELFMSRLQAGPINRQEPKGDLTETVLAIRDALRSEPVCCITCKYEDAHIWDYPCKDCIKYSNWRPK